MIWKNPKPLNKEAPGLFSYLRNRQPLVQRLYVVAAGDPASPLAVKIGVTTDIGQRLASLQTANHEPLTCLETFNLRHLTEAGVHEALATSHRRGEWFNWTAEVRAFIADHQDHKGP